MNFFEYTKAWFRLSRTETNGYFLLLLLSLAVIITPLVLSHFDKKGPVFTREDLAMMDSLIVVFESEDEDRSQSKKFVFDPNNTSLDSLMDLGIPHKIAVRIINYREKGGRFRQKNDLARIYGLDSNLFTALYDYIEIIDDRSNPNLTTDINSAEATDIGALEDIDNRMSARIVSYRHKLGGYVGMDQLYEVYGLDSSKVGTLKGSFYVAAGFRPKKIKINESKLEILSEHPYISENLAKGIIRYRKLNGDIEGMEELKHFRSVDQHQIDKLFPYLEF